MKRTKVRPVTDDTTAKSAEYRVLARKYRPTHFGELIGQDALVRTLTNAIESGRIAHAFMLTGVRGVGKTTTARLIARALNYTGPDGTAGPTAGPTDDCETALAIAQDRHPDVLELDAASRNGVEGIRDLLDGVRYAPSSARYKIYIIDEVHMLSLSAFNALLKTLEEPPAHVKFILATTEIRKVPVTILSRCQRFDLRRVGVEELSAHFTRICEKESVAPEAEAIRLIARAADGSVRDGLSLLDQAIALGNGASVETQAVSAMLGLSDRLRVFDLLDVVLKGDAPAALAVMDDLHNLGADPAAVLQDLLDITHGLAVLKVAGAKDGESLGLPHAALERAKDITASAGLPVFDRAWSILSKGALDITRATDPRKALEMTLLRLIYAADLPDPAKLLKKLASGGGAMSASGAPMPSGGRPSSAPLNVAPMPDMSPRQMGGNKGGEGGAMAMHGHGGGFVSQPDTQAAPGLSPMPQSLSQIVTLCEDRGEMVLASQVYNYMRLVKLQKGRLECLADDAAPANMTQKLAQCLSNWTGERWMVTLATSGAAEKTLAQLDDEARRAVEADVRAHASVKKVISLFPAAEIERIYNPEDNKRP